MPDPLVDVDALVVEYSVRGGVLGRHRPPHRAVDHVSFDIGRGETLGVVGESGSGKSSIANALLGFAPIAAGTARVGDHDLTRYQRSVPKRYRRDVQVVFQDPLSSLNPSMTIEEIVAEPVRLHAGLRATALHARVLELLEAVGLDSRHLDRLPHEVSGGQRQRVAIARALSVGPQLLILDEPVSALDVSTRAQVVNLLEGIAAGSDVSCLLIGHDLAVVRHSSDRIVVMYQGRIVEEGPADRVCDRPVHPYSRLLLASVPEPDPVVQRDRRRRRQELAIQAALATSSGCSFAPRCPFAEDRCWTEAPVPVAITSAGGAVSCHLAATLAPGDVTDPATVPA